MNFWTSADAPWWLSVVTLLIGFFASNFSDSRKFDAEEVRQAKAQQVEREQYIHNRLLDEVSLFVGAVEAFRLHIVVAVNGVKRGSDTRPDPNDASGWPGFKQAYADGADVVGPLSVQASRVLMITDGPVAKAVREVHRNSREFYSAARLTKEEYEAAAKKLSRSSRVLLSATRTAVGIARPEEEPEFDSPPLT